MDKIKQIHFKFKEQINYLIFGGMSTVVNFIVYYICAKVIGIEEVTSSGISWLCAVLFAYITNKLFVFNSKTETKMELIKEMVAFFLARIVTGILCDIGTFALMVKVIGINDIIAKIVTQIMVVILNYVFSKLVIFKNKDKINIKN